MAVIPWNKKYGETLAETLIRFRKEYPSFQNEKITYAGRLDPLAEGLVLLLTGEERFQKEEFLKLPKLYSVDFVLGIQTDSYDILGRIEAVNFPFKKNYQTNFFHELIAAYQGEVSLPYPPFSSRPVSGKPLFVWARERNIAKISIPKQKGFVFHARFLRSEQKSFSTFYQETQVAIKKVKGDFRQEEILSTWNQCYEEHKALQDEVTILSAVFSVSSGVYIRSLVHHIGKQLGTGACSVRIKRKKIGKYSLSLLS